MRQIGYNTQRDNFDFGGQFKASCQCFSTSAWMLLSFFAPSSYKANDDAFLARYVDDVSDAVGKPGVGEEIKENDHAIKGNTAYWWQVHKEAIRKWLVAGGIANPKVVFKDGDCSATELREALKISPVILGTNKMAGLPGGHIILLVDQTEDSFVVNDPFGNATTGYVDKNGSMVKYPKDWILPFISYNRGRLMRAMWIDKNI